MVCKEMFGQDTVDREDLFTWDKEVMRSKGHGTEAEEHLIAGL